MNIIQKRRYMYFFSGMLILASVISFSVWGLKLGIDFTGGVLMEAKFENTIPEGKKIEAELADLNLGSLTTQPTSSGSVILRFVSEEDNITEKVGARISEKFPNSKIDRVEFISSAISGELKAKAVYSIILAVVGIALYIAWAFRRVSFPVSSYKYGITAVVALLHDIIITVGVFVFLGKFYGVEVNLPFIAAMLTILGYSVNDTIVVFDRIRENLLRAGSKDDFENTVNNSIMETLGRSINTSLTVIIVLLALVLLGGSSIQYFALALLIGVFYGTYSSIFVASALLVDSWKFAKNK